MLSPVFIYLFFKKDFLARVEELKLSFTLIVWCWWSCVISVIVWSEAQQQSVIPFFPEDKMNQEKLAKLQAQVRIGGKVTWTFFTLLSLALILAAITHHIVFL